MYNRFSFILIGFVFSALLSCKPEKERKAHEVIKKAIKAHGGQKTWGQLELLNFKKKTTLFTEDGGVESEMMQDIQFRLIPYFEGSVSWENDGLKHLFTFDGATSSYFVGENAVQNQDFLNSKKKDFDALFYVIAQPWKLLEEGALMTYEGQKVIASGVSAEVVKVDYGPEQDLWWYYFDPVTFEMLGNEVQLSDHRSFVENNSMVKENPFLFYGERTSYRVDGKGNKLYVRAKYEYSDFEILLKEN
ncbi:DUF6503 family protein [Algoriphagus machipongonensis]|uniref:Lipoprotein n=1 Tax=Algoriphagus machipongonensis TaxID=388413 RepID=A3I0Y7_9BACT|nr:DUF6503 family protein [Algoriphagus machipongonensis]EAZ80133.1 hypothetical protein ALPR1_15929 [Algoriphagus machipongonensis]